MGRDQATGELRGLRATDAQRADMARILKRVYREDDDDGDDDGDGGNDEETAGGRAGGEALALARRGDFGLGRGGGSGGGGSSFGFGGPGTSFGGPRQVRRRAPQLACLRVAALQLCARLERARRTAQLPPLPRCVLCPAQFY